MKDKIIYPSLSNAKGDILKNWFVQYTINGKRYKIYHGINKLHTPEERQQAALKIIDELTKKLQSGWMPQPQPTYNDPLSKTQKKIDYTLRYWSAQFFEFSRARWRHKTELDWTGMLI